MTSILVGKDGIKHVFTTVIMPLALRDSAKKAKIPISKTLRIALEEKLNEKGNAGAKQLPTIEAPAPLPTADERRGI
jgi:hypothetical protein